ncbi:MAG: sulfotransferase, partial [Opitutales bacterium]
MTDKEEWVVGASLRAVEESLIDEYAEGVSPDGIPCVFVLGSPRTGSTLLYQFLINHFRFHYPTNLFNDSFFETPVAGALFERGLSPQEAVEYESRYGKT